MLSDGDDSCTTAGMTAVRVENESLDGKRLGNYRIVSRIGEGGIGTVYHAEHVILGKAAAIKVLQPELSQNRDMVERFANEARATARLEHPGIVKVEDFGYAPDGSAFIVMELLHGESLASRIARSGRLWWPHACNLGRQIALSLAAAHRARIIHRDLKPDNVFLVVDPDQREERTKVLDFGIAKLAADGAAGWIKTRPDLIMGTPPYMSPQQCRGAGQVDYRADIYSLGCILFEIVCGRPPFIGDGFGDLLNAHMTLPPPRPRELVPELPEALEHLILRMLEKRVEDRPQSMESVAANLDAIAEVVSPIPFSRRSFSRGVTNDDGRASPAPAVTPVPSGQIIEHAHTMLLQSRGSRSLFTKVAVAVCVTCLCSGAMMYCYDTTPRSMQPMPQGSQPPLLAAPRPSPPTTHHVEERPSTKIPLEPEGDRGQPSVRAGTQPSAIPRDIAHPMPVASGAGSGDARNSVTVLPQAKPSASPRIESPGTKHTRELPQPQSERPSKPLPGARPVPATDSSSTAPLLPASRLLPPKPPPSPSTLPSSSSPPAPPSGSPSRSSPPPSSQNNNPEPCIKGLELCEKGAP